MEPLFYLTTVPREQMIERLSQRGARQLPYPTNNVLVTSYKQSMNNLKFAPFSLYVLFPLPHVVGSVSAANLNLASKFTFKDQPCKQHMST